MSSTSSTTEPTPEIQANKPVFEGHPPLPVNLGSIENLPPPVHIYSIPVHLQRLVTLDLSVIHSRATTANDLRDFIKCFYHTISCLCLQRKAVLLDAFIYYVVPILCKPHIFEREPGIFYSFNVPLQIELQEEPGAGEVGNNNNNARVDQDAAVWKLMLASQRTRRYTTSPHVTVTVTPDARPKMYV
ncbi:uncharacterized protein MELLADRAFT_105512 [Melampsora larici-populina 98AG31]|uniref:Uncharacterized protein n=1 Tax=Melampsora larici-populina (strain 98AG31 / pathotype 3-4-7) TaxID=747676 RepID=F4RIG4_MELLP|nr:uncharacterized protein MELLADRAFT_105512 [Melampsora larici-populina 98AG31]EGG07559.1 hypothetical protein MELLADRAFT_105512 [Melampsora larici-populina 98AG31]